MSRVTAPLLSFGASGQIAKTQVFSTWKGLPYVRRYIIPANPKSAAQTLTRSTFANLNTLWKFAAAGVVTAYDAYVSGKPLTARNAIIKTNLSDLREEADLANLVLSPGALGGFAPGDITLTPSDGAINVDMSVPTLPTGWTVAAGWAAAVIEQDPQTGTEWTMVGATNAVDPYDVDLTGLANGTEYRVCGWFSYVRPDGKTAYGVSINDTSTPAP